MGVRPGRGGCDGAGLRPAPCHKSAAGLTRQCKTLGDIQELCAFAVTTHLIFPPETLGEHIETVAIRNVVMMGCSGIHLGPERDPRCSVPGPALLILNTLWLYFE